MVVLTAEQPAPQNWYRAWQLIDTHADASIDSVTQFERGFETSVTINPNVLALSQRFSDGEATE
jgi:hypothetical protein